MRSRRSADRTRRRPRRRREDRRPPIATTAERGMARRSRRRFDRLAGPHRVPAISAETRGGDADTRRLASAPSERLRIDRRGGDRETGAPNGSDRDRSMGGPAPERGHTDDTRGPVGWTGPRRCGVRDRPPTRRACDARSGRQSARAHAQRACGLGIRTGLLARWHRGSHGCARDDRHHDQPAASDRPASRKRCCHAKLAAETTAKSPLY